MYPDSFFLNPLNTNEGGTPHYSAWGQGFLASRSNGLLHRTFALETVLPHDNLKWPARDGLQRNPITPKTTLPRISYGYAGPVLLGPEDSNYYG